MFGVLYQTFAVWRRLSAPAAAACGFFCSPQAPSPCNLTSSTADRPKRLERIFQTYDKPIWFLTFNTYKRLQLLANEAVHERFLSFCLRAGERSISVGQYVIMPAHVHVFASGPPDFDLSKWVRSLKIFVSSAIPATRPHWQDGFFDRLVRREESYTTQWEYIRMNPVHAGLVTDVDDWPYQGQIQPLRYR